MKNRLLQCATVATWIAAETLATPSEGIAANRQASLDVEVTIESTCSVDRPPFPVDLDQAKHLKVNCATTRTPYQVSLDAKSAEGAPLPVAAIRESLQRSDRTVTQDDSKPDTYPSVVTVTVQF